MKKTIIILASLLLVIGVSSCRNNSAKKPATHTHPDGTVHEGATHAEPAKPAAQEQFKTEADTTMKTDAAKHDCGHDHAGHNHKH